MDYDFIIDQKRVFRTLLLLGYSNARNKDTCANLQNIRREVLKIGCLQGAVDITAAQAGLSKIKGKLQKLLDLYLEDRVSKESLDQQSLKLETRRTELEALLASSKAPPLLLYPEKPLTSLRLEGL